ncbi:MAG: metallophosphoesterase [Methanosphaera sp.]|nr:metallophosphoesterase [Methanosphaera sp.]
MRILVISDIHGSPEGVYKYLEDNSVDKIIVTGDITDFGPEDLFIEILDNLSKIADVYAIMGNCDPENANSLLDKSSATNIHDNVVKMDNITLVGFGGSNETPFDTIHEYSEEILYNELIKYNEDLSSENYTILATHAPPLDTNADKIESGAHTGSKAIRDVISLTQPTLNICGHIHESIGKDKIDNTVVVNPGDVANNHACLLIITDEDLENKTVNIELLTLGE